MLNTIKRMIKKGAILEGSSLIFSIWRGYEKSEKYVELLSFFKSHGILPQYIHTSGHSNLIGIKQMIAIVRPKKVVCIHSENANEIKKICGNYINVKDGEPIII